MYKTTICFVGRATGYLCVKCRVLPQHHLFYILLHNSGIDFLSLDFSHETDRRDG